tara:strand:- start:1281 stop:1628 length:348 start_codon:yes stop_codon:yes gene_type:complete
MSGLNGVTSVTKAGVTFESSTLINAFGIYNSWPNYQRSTRIEGLYKVHFTQDINPDLNSTWISIGSFSRYSTDTNHIVFAIDNENYIEATGVMIEITNAPYGVGISDLAVYEFVP